MHCWSLQNNLAARLQLASGCLFVSLIILATVLWQLVYSSRELPFESLELARNNTLMDLTSSQYFAKTFSPTASLSEISENFEACLARAATYAPTLMPKVVALVELNLGFLPMFYNFVNFTKSASPPMDNIVFVALDDESQLAILAKGFIAYRDKRKNFSQNAEQFRSSTYNPITLHKWELAKRALDLEYEPLILDLDVIVLRNPLNFMHDLPICDLTVVPDTFPPLLLANNDSRFSGYEDTIGDYVNINTGLILFRNTRNSVDLVNEFLLPRYRRNIDDQEEFRRFLVQRDRNSTCQQDRHINLSFKERRLQCSKFACFSLNILPPALFSNQRQCFEFQLAQQTIVTPYTVHFNWIFKGYVDKVRRMRQVGLWNV